MFPDKINTFVDLFGGGFNVGINVNADHIIYNDICKQVVGFLKYLQGSNIEEVLQKIDSYIDKYELTKENKEGYLLFREEYNIGIKDEKYKLWGFSDEDCKRYAEADTKKEVADGVQTFNYQCNSMSNSNGQSPFLSVFMYLGETTEYKKELAMIIEEFLNQRLLGLKNEVGVYVTQAFPKLLYVLEEDNIHENSPYWYLTKLAAKCTAKRMNPDYISEKMMRELESPSSFKDVLFTAKTVLIPRHGTLVKVKSGQKKQKINLWNLLIDHILSEYLSLVANV